MRYNIENLLLVAGGIISMIPAICGHQKQSNAGCAEKALGKYIGTGCESLIAMDPSSVIVSKLEYFAPTSLQTQWCSFHDFAFDTEDVPYSLLKAKLKVDYLLPQGHSGIAFDDPAQSTIAASVVSASKQ